MSEKTFETTMNEDGEVLRIYTLHDPTIARAIRVCVRGMIGPEKACGSFMVEYQCGKDGAGNPKWCEAGAETTARAIAFVALMQDQFMRWL